MTDSARYPEWWRIRSELDETTTLVEDPIGILVCIEDVVDDLAERIEQNDALHRMRYAEYLASDEWREVRLAVLRRDGYRCRRCGATRLLNVHHLTYARRGHEDLADLEVLCRPCHEAEHGIENTVT